MKIKVEVRNLFAGYGSPPIIRGLSFFLTEGSVLAVFGKNGSGKTTLLRVLSGILKPISGEVFFDGENIFKMDSFSRSKKISYLPQFYESEVPFTVYEMVELGLYPYRKVKKDMVDSVLNLFDLKKIRNKKFTELSGGQKQKVLLARSIIKDPEILILDEPNLHLDFENTFFIFDTIVSKVKKEGKILIFVLHDINIILRFSDYLLLLKEGGEFLFTEKGKIFEKTDYLKDFINVDFEFFNFEGRNYFLIK
ncbi:MAG: ABC transporter ATP-binding protein [Candidatus Hydrothermales bacterium]